MDYNKIPRIKISEGKLTFPGIKQVYRSYKENSEFEADLLSLDDEPTPPNAEPLLVPVMKKGKLITTLPKIHEIRDFYLENMKILPETYKILEQKDIFRLNISEKLDQLTQKLKKNYQKKSF